MAIQPSAPLCLEWEHECIYDSLYGNYMFFFHMNYHELLSNFFGHDTSRPYAAPPN